MKRHLLLVVSLWLPLSATPANAEIVAAELRVNGLSCPFCAFGIEKKLLDVDGVQRVDVFLDDGRIALTFAPENAATVSDLEQAVEKAGFELAALQLTARGHLLGSEEEGAVLVAGARMRFRLVERRGERTEPISSATRTRLRESAGPGDRSMLITGAVGERHDEEPMLVVESVRAPQR